MYVCYVCMYVCVVIVIKVLRCRRLNMPIRVFYEKSATPFPDVVIVLILRVF